MTKMLKGQTINKQRKQFNTIKSTAKKKNQQNSRGTFFITPLRTKHQKSIFFEKHIKTSNYIVVILERKGFDFNNFTGF